MNSKPYEFCTYFDKNFLVRGLALYNSLKQQNIAFRLWILCYDNYTYDMIRKLGKPEIEAIRLDDFEAANPQLVSKKSERTLVEYYWSSTPLLPLYVFSRDSNIDIVTYLDADLFFFNSPQEAYEELGEQSIYIVPHRFSRKDEVSGSKNAGNFNVGYLSFRNDEEGLKCLRWWSDRCIEWCYNRIEDGKLGDQKYLDDFPVLFKNVVISQHLGVNIGEWNIFAYQLSNKNEMLKINNDNLIVFHFNCVDIINPRKLYCIQGKSYRILYQRYAFEIANSYTEIVGIDKHFNFGFQKQSLINHLFHRIRGRIFEVPKV